MTSRYFDLANFSDSAINGTVRNLYSKANKVIAGTVYFHLFLSICFSFFYETHLISLTVGILATLAFQICIYLMPNSFFTRCMVGVVLQTFVALHIYELHGLPEMHFFFFTAFAMMIVYLDPWCMWPGAFLIIGQHILMAALQNSGIYLNFYEEGYISVTKLGFHFGIALLHVGICSYWAAILKRRAMADAKVLENLDAMVKVRTAELVESTSILADAQAIAKVGNWVWNIGSNKIIWSDELYRIFGLVPPSQGGETITFDHYLKLIHPEDLSAQQERISIASQTGQNFNFDHRIVLSDGQIKTLSCRLLVKKNEKGEIFQLMGTAQDVTEQKTIEKALREAVKVKADFLANMSHEIRTPLNGIIGITDLLETTQLNTLQKKYVRVVADSGSSLLTLVNDILDFSAIEAGKMKLEYSELNLVSLIEGQTDLLMNRAAEKQLSLVSNIDPNIPRIVKSDPGRIGQILLNLIGNAIKFTEKGSVEVSAKLEHKNDKTCQILFAVRDTGIGLSTNDQNLLFQPFTQADGSIRKKYGGTGLGLSISKQIVQLLGGDIGVRSEVNKGSTFYFRLPLEITVNASQTEMAMKPVVAENIKFSGRVLVAEDNQVNQMVVKSMLTKLGLSCHIVQNGCEAIDALKSEHFDFVLMDCHMPIMDGYDATSAIREWEKLTSKHIPIIALTANVLSHDMEKCRECGMDGYLSKPLKTQHLSDAIVNLGILPVAG